MVTTSVREQVLQLIREERDRQLSKYGTNADLHHGFGAAWLYPYSMDCAPSIEAVFRADYENYEGVQGQPTWMHLIREEVAELFESAEREHTVSEAVQVAALCVSLAEQLMAPRAEVVPPPLPLSNANRGLIEKAYDDGFGGAFELTRDPENPSWVIGTYDGRDLYYVGREIDGVLYSIATSRGGMVSVLVGEELIKYEDGQLFLSVREARDYIKKAFAK